MYFGIHYKIDELIDSLNKSINRNDLSVKTTDLLDELLETLKTIENCTNCKDIVRIMLENSILINVMN